MDPIDDFLSGKTFAVAGASRDPEKYGNRVLHAFHGDGYEVFGVNPKETEIDGIRCVAHLADLPGGVHGLSIVTPPKVTEALVEEAARVGIRRVWMQQGAESDVAIERAKALGLEVIAGGPCVLVALSLRR